MTEAETPGDANVPPKRHHPDEPAATMAPSESADSGGMFQPTLDYHADTQPGTGGPQSPARPIRTLGDYEVLGTLGRGGMGVVYKAQHRKLNRVVALKMVLQGAHASPDELARFLTEARAVAHLQHPNIVQIFDIGEMEGLPFFSLEFVDGSNLAKQLARQPQRAEEAARLVETLARAMHYAHQHGVLHRDLKPANILLTTTGTPKIADFGLAKRIEDATDDGSTRTGTVLGTPSYMSPEQARGDIKQVGPLSDQYSLGALLYETVTGRPPFAAPRPVETLLQVMQDEPVRPRDLQPSIPSDLETICLKCLQKDPSRRYASCSDFAEDLGRFLRHEPIMARPISRVERSVRWCQRNRLVASLVATVFVALLAVAVVASWSAITVAERNESLRTSNLEKDRQSRLADSKAEEAARNEQLAKEKARIAEENALKLTKYVRNSFTTIGQLDLEEVPRARPLRDLLLRESIDAMRQVVEQLPKTSEAEPIYAALQMSIVESLIEAQRIDEADVILREVRTIFERRVQLKRGSDASRANLVRLWTELGDLRRDYQRDLQESRNLHTQARDLAKQIVDAPATDAEGKGKLFRFEARYRYADTLTNLAATLYRIGQPAEAVPLFEAAAAIRAEIRQSFDSDPELDLKEQQTPGFRASFRGELEGAIRRQKLGLAAARFRNGDSAGALPWFQEAMRDAETDLAADPGSLKRQGELMGMLGFYGEVLAQLGKQEEAMPLLDRSAALAAQLELADPEGAKYRRGLAVSYYRQGAWRKAFGLPNAEEPLAKCLALREAAAKKEPQNQRRQLDWMLILARIGDLALAEQIAETQRHSERLDSELLLDVARAYTQCGLRSEGEQRAKLFAKAQGAIHAAEELGFQDRVYLRVEVDLSR